MEQINIQTTQNVGINYQLAGLADRFMATLIDFGVLYAYTIAATLIAVELGVYNSLMLGSLIMLPAMFYHLICEIYLEGQSIGKKQMNIKVVRLDGKQVSIASYLIRWLFRLIDITMTFGGVAIVSVVLSNKGQRLGDMAAGTAVIHLKKETRLSDTLFLETDEDYQPTFLQAQNLSDKDATIIKEILDGIRKTENNKAVFVLVDKVKEILQIDETDLPPRKFLSTVIKDYNYFNS